MKQLIFIVVMLFSITRMVGGEGPNYRITEPWDYPLRPGMSEWAAVEDMYAALQIPAPVYTEMTTAALLESCLNFPLKSDIYAVNSLEEGFGYVVSRIDAFKELFGRNDLSSEVLRQYTALNAAEVVSNKAGKVHTFPYYAYIHQLVKRKEVLTALAKEDARWLAHRVLQNLKLVRNSLGASASDDHAAKLLVEIVKQHQFVLHCEARDTKIADYTIPATFEMKELGTDEITKLIQFDSVY